VSVLNSAAVAGWTELPVDDALALSWRNQYGPDVPPPRALEHGPLRALVGREPVGRDYDDLDPRWHISISRADRLPQWHELVDAAHQLRPGVVFVVGIPPRSWWMNVHPYCLHLWETRDPHLVAEWRSNARGDTPT
jgi:hypothetical protein